MSEFGIFVEEISEILVHDNADALEVATLKGKCFQFIVGKGNFKPGDKVFYFPVDALIPPGLDTKLGVEGKLAGSTKNRVKTIKLRGKISQGIVAPLSIYEGTVEEGKDYAPEFGVEKYEIPITYSSSGNMHQMPEYIRSKYDIESAQRYGYILDYLADNNIEVVIVEKVEGTQLNVALDDVLHICSRNNKWERVFDNEGKPHQNVYLDVAERNPQIQEFLKWEKERHGAENVALRSEVVGPGIKKNVYQLKEIDYYAFDIVVNGWHLSYEKFEEDIMDFNAKYLDKKSYIKTAPFLYRSSNIRDYLGCKTIVEKAYGTSMLNPLSKNLREGIVIRPSGQELHHYDIGRIILKVRCPIYLEKYGL